MEITRRPGPDIFTVAVTGRLDSYWSKALTDELDEVIRGGARQINLDCSQLGYVSSAGIRVLLRAYKDLKAINGTFAVVDPSPSVRSVLKLGGMDMLLVPEKTGPKTEQPAPAPAPSEKAERSESESALYEIFRHGAGVSTCTVRGNPERLANRSFTAEDCRSVEFSARKVGLGLGAFGNDFADCGERFGEFLAVAGSAAYLPGDGTKTVDFSVTSGALRPKVQMLYGLECEGDFSTLACFEARPPHRSVGLSELAAKALEIAQAPHAVVVAVAESAGLVGASLKKTPVAATNGGAGFFSHPSVREWLTFTTERGYARTLPLVAGVVSSASDPTLDPLLRPLPGAPGLRGHFHAAVFGYRPLKKGWLDLAPTVAGLFDSENAVALLHLIPDTREYLGVGESEFTRGAFWISPIRKIERAAS